MLGTAAIGVTDEDERWQALRLITDHLSTRPVGGGAAADPQGNGGHRQCLALPLAEASVKIRTGMPGDPPEDLDPTVWAGILPMSVAFGATRRPTREWASRTSRCPPTSAIASGPPCRRGSSGTPEAFRARTRILRRMNDRLVWIDCEMTGLDISHDALIEVACLVTDPELNLLDAGVDVIIKPPAEALDQMKDIVRTMHTTSGLLAGPGRRRLAG